MQEPLIAGTKFPAAIGIGTGLELTTPLGRPSLLQGGVHHVENIAARNSIPAIFREWGMYVEVEDVRNTYKLKQGYNSLDIEDNANWKLILEVPEITESDAGKLLRVGTDDNIEWGPVISDWKPITMLGVENTDWARGTASTPRYKIIDSLLVFDGLISFITVSSYSHTTSGQGFQFGTMPAADASLGGGKDVLMTKRIIDSGIAFVLGSYIRLVVTSGGLIIISTIHDSEIDIAGNTPTKTDPRRGLTSVFTTAQTYTKHDGSTANYPFNFNGADSEQLGGFSLDLRGLTISRF